MEAPDEKNPRGLSRDVAESMQRLTIGSSEWVALILANGS